MYLTKSKLYLLLAILCLAGYSWLFINYTNPTIHNHEYTVCIVKNVTGIPCPSCGATRSVLSIASGNVMDGMSHNPLGFVLLSVLLIAPFWLLFDWITQKETLFLSYRKAEQLLKRKQYAIPLIALVLTNWVWNIYKGL
jgi:hypothetical protein